MNWKSLCLLTMCSAVGFAEPKLPKPIRISAPAGGSMEASDPSLVRAARAAPIHRQVLRNGLRVLVSEAPQEDMIALELLVQAGAMEETTPIEGMGQIVQELIQHRVTDGPNGSDPIEDAAAQFRVTPELDYTRITLVSTRGEFRGLLANLAQALKKRPVTQTELDEVRRKLMRDIGESPGALTQLYDIFRQSFYRYHPYKRSGRPVEAVVERMRPKVVEDFLDQYFVANRMVVSLSGRVDRTEAVEWVQKVFADVPQRDIRQLEVTWEPKSLEKEVFLTGGGQVGWLFVGFPAPPAPSRDYVAMKIINSTLGEGLSSRLFTEIREKRSLCYELGSMYPVLRGPSHFLTYTVTKPEQVWPARKQLLIEIDKLKKSGISQQELEESKRKVIGAYWQERETNQGRAFQAALGEMIGVGYEFDAQFMKLLGSVNTSDIQDVARRYLDNATLIVARPRGIFYWDL